MTAVLTSQAPPCTTDPDAWFSDEAAEQAHARALCGGCPIADTCLDGAIQRQEAHGIFGGLDPVERNAVARLRGAPLAGAWRHGEPAAYKAHGCRCDACRRAHARDVTAWRTRHRLAAPATRAVIVVHELATTAGRGRYRAYPGQLFIGGIQ